MRVEIKSPHTFVANRNSVRRAAWPKNKHLLKSYTFKINAPPSKNSDSLVYNAIDHALSICQLRVAVCLIVLGLISIKPGLLPTFSEVSIFTAIFKKPENYKLLSIISAIIDTGTILKRAQEKACSS